MTHPPILTRDQQVRLWGLALIGGMLLAIGAVIAPDRTWANLLLGSYYLLTIGLGGAVFVALTNVSGAGWHVALRRIPEAMAMILPFAGTVMVLVLAVRMREYGWQLHGQGDAGTFWFKQLWLTPWFWLARSVAYVAVWALLAGWLVARSRQQDVSPARTTTKGNVRISALFLAVYAITSSLASVDWIMALEPMWFSTMWGVYNFAGTILAALALIVVLGLILRAPGGPLRGVFSDEHLHDLGKLLLGFSCFWMYIWFCQYMLIWYSNIPEETSYFISRTRGAWGPIVVASIVLNWVVPFFVLLPQPAKRNASVMMKIAVVLLIGRWVDLYTMIFPARFEAAPVFGLWELAAIGGFVGVGSLWLCRSFTKADPVPRHDPYLNESLNYHAR